MQLILYAIQNSTFLCFTELKPSTGYDTSTLGYIWLGHVICDTCGIQDMWYLIWHTEYAHDMFCNYQYYASLSSDDDDDDDNDKREGGKCKAFIEGV